MKRKVFSMSVAALLTLFLGGPVFGEPADGPFVRWAELEIDPSKLGLFAAATHQHVDAALQEEPGLLALHVTAESDRPTHVRVFEMYVDEAAYRAHLESAHFKRFVSTTQSMIGARRLFTALPIRAGSKALSTANPQVRVADLQIAPEQIAAYRAAVTEEIDASMGGEPGVRAIYSVALKDDPGAMRFFEIYADDAAYRSHIASPHFRKYVETTKEMITARRLILTTPIVLQSKSPTATP